VTASTVTLRPNQDYGFNTAGVVGGAGSAHATVSDNSDSTYLTTGLFGFGFGASGLAAEDQIISVTLRMRSEHSGGSAATTAVSLLDPSTGRFSSASWPIPDATPTTHSLTMFKSIGGETITKDVLELLVVQGQVPTNGRLYEIYLDVVYNTAPIVSAIAPSTTIGTASPLFTWTYTDAEGDPQERADILVYDSATVAALSMGTTPTATTKALYQNSIHSTFQTFQDPTLILPPGGYRVYIRAADQGANGTRGPWAHADFTIASAPPPSPRVIVGAYAPVFGRVPLTVESYDNLLTDNQGGAETSTADFALGNCTAALDTLHLWSPPNGPTISTHSLKTTSSGAGGNTVTTPVSNATGVPVVVGQMYVAGAHVESTTARLAYAVLNWVDATNSVISNTIGPQMPTATGSAPAPIMVAGVAPANAVRATVTINVLGTAGSENHWFDAFVIAATDTTADALCSTWNGNLVSNTSFETYAGSSGAADWNFHTSGGSQSVTAVIETSPDGGQACRVAKNETSLAPPYAEWPNLAGSVPALPVAAGQVLIITGYQNVGSGNGVTVEVVYNDATHDEFTCPKSALSTWEPFIVAIQIPSGKTSASVRFLPVGVGANGSQGVVDVDAVNIFFGTTGIVATFHAIGGASGTPKGAGLGSGSGKVAFFMGVPFQPYFPWVRGGFALNATYALRRSVDGGATWTDVRGLASFGTTFYDYEATPNSTALYTAQEITADPVSAAVVGSPELMPLIKDPGFESQTPWTGIDPTNTWANGFQPFFGSLVSGIVGSDGSPGTHLKSSTAIIPAWAASMRIRFLMRTVNAQGPVLTIHWYDLMGGEAFGTASGSVLTGSAGDSGWYWYELSVTIPAFATSCSVEFFGFGAVDSAQPWIAAFDAVNVIPIALNNTSPACDVPALICDAWLKDPLNPGANMKVNVEITGLTGSGNASAAGTESVSTEAQLVMQPAGRAAPVVIADTVVTDEAFTTLQILLENDQQWAAIEGLRRAQRTLLLQLPYGDLLGVQFYVRLGSARTAGIVQTQDQGRHQRRRFSIPALQVAAP